ncbi:MAG: glycoside hydrolase, partial [Kiritimatiellae bacterium]|nr:glycoside hydrolase [Kiritimatiellia bacterium]
EPMFAEFPWTQHGRALSRLKPLRPKDVTRMRQTDDGVELDFRSGGADFRICMRVTGRGDEFVFEIHPLPTGYTDLLAAELPGPLVPADGSPVQILLGYRHQGRLFTGRPGALEPELPERKELDLAEGQYRMRFFGVLGDTVTAGRAKSGYVAIIDENADARLALRQAGDGRVTCSVRWIPSMGTLAYPRRIRYRFQTGPTVTSLTKAFREYARSMGLFRTLIEKIDQRPVVGRLVGATGCFIGYEASTLDYVATFRRLREMGHQGFYVFPVYHINCGFKGEFAGMKLIDLRPIIPALRDLGGILASWTYLAGLPEKPALLRLAMRNADGSAPLNWRIGDEAWIQTCMLKACEWLDASREEIGHADAHHFDTTASNSLMECYAPSHPANRRMDREARIALFQEVARHGCAVASEGVKDWAVPWYDIGSNKEVPVLHETPAFRVVPVQHLVYHDAFFSLWWEVHTYDCPYFGAGNPEAQALTDILYGDMPLIFPVGRQYRWLDRAKWRAEEFEQSLELERCLIAAQRAVEVARHFERLATSEMTNFTWLTEDGAVQQTEFSNGEAVIANFGEKPFVAGGGRVVPPMGATCL